MKTVSNEKRNRIKFLALWFGQLISSIGTGMSAFALGIHVYKETGLATSSTLITLFAFLPSLLLSPLAGVLADRYNRRYLMMAGDALSAVGLIYIIYCLNTTGAAFWQIALGVIASSVFASLLEPAYRSSITDLLPKKDYARANGLVQLANSSKYLLSPVIAGFLTGIVPLWTILLFDVATILFTVTLTFLAFGKPAHTCESPKATDVNKSSIIKDFSEGLRTLISAKEVFALVFVSTMITFFIGILQTLATPMILGFQSPETAGIILSGSALGILLGSALLSIFSLKGPYLPKLFFSLFFAGIFMACFGLLPSASALLVSGFLFFAMMPTANACLDILVRSNIENRLQGRLWALIGFISQMGYVLAFSLAGPVSDWVFTPFLKGSGILSKTFAALIGGGDGRGSALTIFFAGILLSLLILIMKGRLSLEGLEAAAGEMSTPVQE